MSLEANTPISGTTGLPCCSGQSQSKVTSITMFTAKNFPGKRLSTPAHASAMALKKSDLLPCTLFMASCGHTSMHILHPAHLDSSRTALPSSMCTASIGQTKAQFPQPLQSSGSKTGIS